MDLKQNWDSERKLAIQAKPMTILELQQFALAAGYPELHKAQTDILKLFRYRQFQIEGQFLPNKNILLDNQILNGQAGYRVLTPFQPSTPFNLILVDRGFIPWGQDRKQLPLLPIPAEAMRIIGRLTQLSQGIVLKEDSVDVNPHWPLQIQKIDYQKLSDLLKQQIFPFLIQLPQGAPYSYQNLPPSVGLSPTRHLGYAIQWFTMAGAILIYYWITNMKRK